MVAEVTEVVVAAVDSTVEAGVVSTVEAAVASTAVADFMAAVAAGVGPAAVEDLAVVSLLPGRQARVPQGPWQVP
jgi:hypothetical protein